MNKLQQLRENLAPIKVLYVEDEQDLREQTLIFLKKIFMHVDSETNGKDGLASFKKKDYDIVITDLKMPKMNGHEMIKRIQELDNRCTIIIMTASDGNTDATQTISYLHKPVIFTEFIDILESLQEKILLK